MKNSTEEKIKVMQAFVEGRAIETRDWNRLGSGWVDVKEPLWNWQYFDYRIKKGYTVYLQSEEYHRHRSASFNLYEEAEAFGQLMINQIEPAIKWISYHIEERIE